MILTPRHHERETSHEAVQAVEFLGRSDAGKQLLKDNPRNSHRRVPGHQTSKRCRHMALLFPARAATECQGEDGRIQENHRFLRARL